MKIAAITFNILSIGAMIVSILMIIAGTQPCSGDGCLIHILYIIGTPILIVSSIIFYITYKKAWKNK